LNLKLKIEKEETRETIYTKEYIYMNKYITSG
jgi:hypothetical protein